MNTSTYYFPFFRQHLDRFLWEHKVAKKVKVFLATFGPKLWSITLFVLACYGAMKVLWGFVHGSGGMRRRVWFKIQKFRYSSGHPHARPKKRIRSPSPARSPWHAAHNAKRPARPTNQYGTQSGGIQQSACAANRTHARPHGRI